MHAARLPVLIAAALAMVVAACPLAHSQGSSAALRPAETRDGAFVQKAAEASMAELELSRIASEQAQSAEVRAFAQRMVQDHAQSAAELQIIAAHQNIALPDALSDEHLQLRSELAHERGRRFDSSYMNAMLTDHQTLAKLLRSSEASVSTDELRTYIKKTLAVAEHHLRMAEGIATE